MMASNPYWQTAPKRASLIMDQIRLMFMASLECFMDCRVDVRNPRTELAGMKTANHLMVHTSWGRTSIMDSS